MGWIHSHSGSIEHNYRKAPHRHIWESEAMSLEQELAAFKADFARTAPAGRAALYEAKIEELRAEFALENATDVDDSAPDFALPNAAGNSIILKELLRSGPAVLIFYRAGWCPYCNIQRH